LEQGHPALGQASPGDVIQAKDSGRGFSQIAWGIKKIRHGAYPPVYRHGEFPDTIPGVTHC
jgi:hypothetical protein